MTTNELNRKLGNLLIDGEVNQSASMAKATFYLLIDPAGAAEALGGGTTIKNTLAVVGNGIKKDPTNTIGPQLDSIIHAVWYWGMGTPPRFLMFIQGLQVIFAGMDPMTKPEYLTQVSSGFLTGGLKVLSECCKRKNADEDESRTTKFVMDTVIRSYGLIFDAPQVHRISAAVKTFLTVDPKNDSIGTARVYQKFMRYAHNIADSTEGTFGKVFFRELIHKYIEHRVGTQGVLKWIVEKIAEETDAKFYQ